MSENSMEAYSQTLLNNSRPYSITRLIYRTMRLLITLSPERIEYTLFRGFASRNLQLMRTVFVTYSRPIYLSIMVSFGIQT